MSGQLQQNEPRPMPTPDPAVSQIIRKDLGNIFQSTPMPNADQSVNQMLRENTHDRNG